MRLFFTLAFVSIIFVSKGMAESIDFGNSFFNKDRSNSVSRVITIKNDTDTALDYNVSFTSHNSMQTSDIKVAPLTEDVYDEDQKETYTSIVKDSCIQHYGEQLFNIPSKQACRLHLTFIPTEARNYSEKMVISTSKTKKEYDITGNGIMMPNFTVIYYTDNSGENIDNKRAEYSIKWTDENAGIKSDELAYIKIKKDPKDNKPLKYTLTGDGAFFIDKKLSTCTIKGDTIVEPADEACGIVIGFIPNAAGDFSARLQFNKRILSGAKEYILSGSATDVLDFGTVYFGGNVQKILIANSTDKDQSYSILQESKGANFRIVNLKSPKVKSCVESSRDTGFTLKKGESCYLGFTFAPDRNSEFSKKFIIMSNNGERKEITLKGVGVEKLEDISE